MKKIIDTMNLVFKIMTSLILGDGFKEKRDGMDRRKRKGGRPRKPENENRKVQRRK